VTGDLLARVWPHAEDLLHRIDAQVRIDGAPADHPVWDLVRRVGALPSAAIEHFLWLEPAPLRRAREQMLDEAESAQAALSQVRGVAWEGAGANAFRDRWAGLVQFADAVDQRFIATAEFLADVAQWMQHSRDELAIEMAACLGSREAMAIKVDLDHRTAAADLAERILAAAASCLDQGWDLRAQWADRLGDVPWRKPSGPGVVSVTHLEVR
jgi:uncharacterized protein YukE